MEKKRRTSLSGGARWLPASVTLVEGESGVLESGVSYATDLLYSLSAVQSKTATSHPLYLLFALQILVLNSTAPFWDLSLVHPS